MGYVLWTSFCMVIGSVFGFLVGDVGDGFLIGFLVGLITSTLVALRTPNTVGNVLEGVVDSFDD